MRIMKVKKEDCTEIFRSCICNFSYYKSNRDIYPIQSFMKKIMNKNVKKNEKEVVFAIFVITNYVKYRII